MRQVLCVLVVAATAAGWRDVVGQSNTPKSSASLNAATLGTKVKNVIQAYGDGIEVSLWVGGSEGDPWYTWQATTPRPAASAIKTAYLIELFSAFADKLDAPLPGAGKLLADDAHPAWAPFTAPQRVAARRSLERASVRYVGEVMMGRAEATNDVYNAAANLTTAVLGGPEALTKKIHSRDPAFRGITARRYMLAERYAGKDNDATAAALASVMQLVSRGRGLGLAPKTAKALREAMEVNDSDPAAKHYFKPGSLGSDPITEVRTGWFEYKQGTVVYVVMAVQPNPGKRTRKEAREHLEKTSFALRDLIVAAARQAKAAR